MYRPALLCAEVYPLMHRPAPLCAEVCPSVEEPALRRGVSVRRREPALRIVPSVRRREPALRIVPSPRPVVPALRIIPSLRPVVPALRKEVPAVRVGACSAQRGAGCACSAVPMRRVLSGMREGGIPWCIFHPGNPPCRPAFSPTVPGLHLLSVHPSAVRASSPGPAEVPRRCTWGSSRSRTVGGGERRHCSAQSRPRSSTKSVPNGQH